MGVTFEPQPLSEMPVRYPQVAVDHGMRLGHLYNEPGESFDLGNMFDENARLLGSDKFSEVFMRTESGNIYRLTDEGQLTNMNMAKQKGMEQATYQMTDDEMAKISDRSLSIGEKFTYGNTDQFYTTAFTEIVPVTSKMYVPEYLKTMTDGKTNSIVEDFSAGIKPPTPPVAA